MTEQKHKHKLTIQKARRLLRYLRPYWWLEIEVLACMTIAVILGLVNPLVIKVLIDDVFVARNIGLLHIIMGALVGLYVIRALFIVVTTYLYNFVGQRMIFDIRSHLFQHLQRLDLGFYHRTKIGEMISRVNNDVESLQSMVTTTFVDLITDLLTVVAILAVVLYLDWRLTLVSLTVVPFFALSIAYFGKRIKIKSKQVREKIADILHFFHETFSGIKVVQSYVREKYEARRFVGKGRDLINLRIGQGVLGSLATASAGLFAAIGPALVLWYGGYRTMEGALTIGALVAFYAYIKELFSPILRLAHLNVVIQTALASIDRIFEFMDIDPAIQDAPDAIVPSGVRGDITFRNVNFSYRPGEPILSDVSFEVRRGQTVAIVGPSGVGKTTVINLVCRFYDPTSGSIELDGVEIRNIKVAFLRKLVGTVSQETFLFNASIRENLRYGNRRATQTDIIDAAMRANIHDFIESLPDRYDTQVGDRGMRLSGGQQQRLSIARAILKNPKILVLDEATSSLDSQSETLIQQALEPLMKERTSLVIAHRLSTVIGADNILVLDRGQIVQSGTHTELLAHGGLYELLWEEQIIRKEVR
jgi:ABC-type multidrug transport system fused ATPase/permease subunit